MNTPDTAQLLPDTAPGSIERLVADEHRAIRDHLPHLRGFAIALPDLDRDAAHERAGLVLDFLKNDLLPHAAAEESSLYPAIDRLVGAGTTQTMTLDHQAIADMIGQLGTATKGDFAFGGGRLEAQRLLFILEAFLATHLWKEETAYLPLLARLEPGAYTALHDEIAGHTAHHEHNH